MTSLGSLSTRSEHIGTLYFVALLREELGLTGWLHAPLLQIMGNPAGLPIESELSDAPPRPEDLAALGRFFKSAPELLAGQKYHWQTLELAPGTELTHDFGPSGRR